MSGHLKELQKRLLGEVGETVRRCGFDSKPIGQSFYQRLAYGRASFHLSFIPHDQTDFDVTADVAIRFDDVEQLVNEDNALLSPQEKTRTSTLGAEFGNIEKGKQMRWTVAADPDVSPTAKSLIMSLERIGMPYIQKYSDPHAALSILSGNGPSSWLYAPLHGARCERAVALAFTLREYDRLDQLIEQNEMFLKSSNDFGLRSFQDLARRLRAKLRK